MQLHWLGHSDLEKILNSETGQRSTELWTKRSRELLTFSSNSRPDLAGAEVEKTVFLQYEVDLATLWQRVEFRTQERTLSIVNY